MPSGDESALNRPVRALMFEVGPGFRPSNCFWHRRSRRAKCDACPPATRVTKSYTLFTKRPIYSQPLRADVNRRVVVPLTRFTIGRTTFLASAGRNTANTLPAQPGSSVCTYDRSEYRYCCTGYGRSHPGRTTIHPLCFSLISALSSLSFFVNQTPAFRG